MNLIKALLIATLVMSTSGWQPYHQRDLERQ